MAYFDKGASRANIVDRVVGYFNPRAGLRRSVARDLLTRAYEGASRKDGWNVRRAGASATADHQADAVTLRVRARALVQNVPYIAQGMRSLVSQTVGTGIIPRWIGEGAAQYNKLWDAWVPYADADGLTDAYGLQAAAYRAMEQDGEVLVRIRSRRPSDGLPVPVQFQLLEIDWLDSSRNERNGNNTIISGIEYDLLGRRVAYWLYDQHPGDIGTFKGLLSRSSRPVPADRIIHLFSPDRPGQARGITRLAPVIASVRDLQLYMDAEIQRKNLETRLSVLGSMDADALGEDPAAVGAGDLGDLAGGGITAVPPGLNLTVVEPKAAPGYTDYVKQCLHLIAAGWGVTYEMMTGDMSEVNFSSARVRQNDFRRDVESTQWRVLIPQLCAAMCRVFAEHAALAGSVRAVSVALRYTAPKWSSPNPLQDVSADLAEVGAGMSSISAKIRARGDDPAEVFAELKADLERLQEDGTLPMMLAMQKAVMPAVLQDVQAQQDEKKTPQKKA